MKVKDVSPGRLLSGIPVVIPDEVEIPEELGTRIVSVRSTWNLGAWVKPWENPTDRIFPVTPLNPETILEWEILEGAI